ncbi:hypothetical protein ASE37_17670 [Rhizobium sp. Root268]|nr:hypothetical protein ASC86_17755 [Rhizobium sp. Root1212]KRD22539.1 hypothetical protein ASE37_17670 [Rhizobium sp. Root268]
MLIYSFVVAVAAQPYPDLFVAYQGIRKSLMWLMAIFIGSVLSIEYRSKILFWVLVSCTIVCAYGVKQYFAIGEFDQQLLAAQSASEYANKISGATRATSVLSSGFHLGMAGCLVIAIILFDERPNTIFRCVLLGIAAFAIYASLTRTFLIISLMLLIGKLVGRNLPRVYYISVFVVLIILLCACFDLDVLGGIIDAVLDDSRFLNRGESYVQFLEFMKASPSALLLGFGPGSAGSTLGTDFIDIGAAWIEPHNIFLKYTFEFGAIVTIILVILITQTVLKDRTGKGLVSLSSSLLFIVTVSGLTITSVEAWPITLYIGFIIGCSVPFNSSLQFSGSVDNG